MTLAGVNVPHYLWILQVDMRLVIVILTDVLAGLNQFTNVHTCSTCEFL